MVRAPEQAAMVRAPDPAAMVRRPGVRVRGPHAPSGHGGSVLPMRRCCGIRPRGSSGVIPNFAICAVPIPCAAWHKVPLSGRQNRTGAIDGRARRRRIVRPVGKEPPGRPPGRRVGPFPRFRGHLRRRGQGRGRVGDSDRRKRGPAPASRATASGDRTARGRGGKERGRSGAATPDRQRVVAPGACAGGIARPIVRRRTP